MSAEVIKLAERRKLKHPEADVLALPLLMIGVYVALTVALAKAFADQFADSR